MLHQIAVNNYDKAASSARKRNIEPLPVVNESQTPATVTAGAGKNNQISLLALEAIDRSDV